STNGTFLNGLRITQARLKNGDVIEFGVGGPKLSFEYTTDPIAKTPNARSIAPALLQTTNRTESSGRSKEFGRDTVQVMLERALHISSRRLKFALTASLLALITAISIIFYQYLSQKRSTLREPNISAVQKVMSFGEIA